MGDDQLRSYEQQVCQVVRSSKATRHASALKHLAAHQWSPEQLEAVVRRRLLDSVAVLLEHAPLQHPAADLLCQLSQLRPDALAGCAPTVIAHLSQPLNASSSARGAGLRLLCRLATVSRSAAALLCSTPRILGAVCASLSHGGSEEACWAGRALRCLSATAAAVVVEEEGLVDLVGRRWKRAAAEAPRDEQLLAALAGCFAHLCTLPLAALRIAKKHEALPVLASMLHAHQRPDACSASEFPAAAALIALAAFAAAPSVEVRGLLKAALLDASDRSTGGTGYEQDGGSAARGGAIGALLQLAVSPGRLQSSTLALRALWAVGAGDAHVKDKWVAAPYSLVAGLAVRLTDVWLEPTAGRHLAGEVEHDEEGEPAPDVEVQHAASPGAASEVVAKDVDPTPPMVPPPQPTAEGSANSDLLLEDSIMPEAEAEVKAPAQVAEAEVVAVVVSDAISPGVTAVVPAAEEQAAVVKAARPLVCPSPAQVQAYWTAAYGLLSSMAATQAGVKACVEGGVGGALAAACSNVSGLGLEARQQVLALACNLCCHPAGVKTASVAGALLLAHDTLAAVHAGVRSGAGDAVTDAVVGSPTRPACATSLKDQQGAAFLIVPAASTLANVWKGGLGTGEEGDDYNQLDENDDDGGGRAGIVQALGSTADASAASLDVPSTTALLCSMVCARVGGGAKGSAHAEELRALLLALAGAASQLDGADALESSATITDVLVVLLQCPALPVGHAAATALWSLLRHGVVHPDVVVRRMIQPLDAMLKCVGGIGAPVSRQQADAAALVEVLSRSASAASVLLRSCVAERLLKYYRQCQKSKDRAVVRQLGPFLCSLAEMGDEKRPTDKYKVFAAFKDT